MASIYLIRNVKNQKLYAGKTIGPLAVRFGVQMAYSDMLTCRAIKKHSPSAYRGLTSQNPVRGFCWKYLSIGKDS